MDLDGSQGIFIELSWLSEKSDGCLIIPSIQTWKYSSLALSAGP